MGTRHRQAVISKDGELKIQQYGQWDGYPDGQGTEILSYLRTGDLEKYQENLIEIPLITEDQAKELDDDGEWAIKHPYLSRDCGYEIHKMIENGVVPFVAHIEEEEARKWCEGFYTINFKTNEFISEYYAAETVFKLDDLPTDEEYLKAMEQEDED